MLLSTPRAQRQADVSFDESQQVRLRNLIFQAEIVEQRFRAVVLPHHDQQALFRQRNSSVLLTCFCPISPANLGDFFNTHA